MGFFRNENSVRSILFVVGKAKSNSFLGVKHMAVRERKLSNHFHFHSSRKIVKNFNGFARIICSSKKSGRGVERKGGVEVTHSLATECLAREGVYHHHYFHPHQNYFSLLPEQKATISIPFFKLFLLSLLGLQTDKILVGCKNSNHANSP